MGEDSATLVDDRQQERLEHRFGAGARQWVAELPSLVDKIATRWGLTLEGRSTPGFTSMVLRCRCADGSAGALKISPDPGLIRSEASRLALWRGTGRVPEVWEVDADAGALLMEAIEPGESILETGQVPPMERVGGLLAGLHAIPVDEYMWRELKPLQGWVRYYFEVWERRRSRGPAAQVVSAALMHQGHARARALAAAEDNVVLLHGYPHAGNVLEGGTRRGLVAVDPRACLGDPSFDAMDWVSWRAESLEEVWRRISVLAPAINVSAERLFQVCSATAPIFAVARVLRGDASPREIRTLLDLASG